ncbi:ATP-binding protein [Inhella gelatinilytica]|uniref:histidine kinase n=1 Tax=Inhella gelatinilytica TaxID=2795030 RepID=A0A931NE24_9BURK|nr:ATP-binding protein [Inhella gelatinilytica]MBH9552830.1 hypothetical protein [Inhella gelatinilytica]
MPPNSPAPPESSSAPESECPPAAPVRGRVHWTVKNNYPLRVGSYFCAFVAVVLHGTTLGIGPGLFAFFAVHLLVYPHVVFWVACRAVDSRQAEVRSLFVDSLLFGVMTAALQFPLWVAFPVYIASTLNLVINHGGPGWVRSQLSFAAGVVLGGVVWGWKFSPETEWPVTLVCIVGVVIYLSIIGRVTHRSNVRLREIRQALSQRTAELSQALAQLQQTQADLLEAEKLAALGSLVAGVAHELNTPIGNALVTATALDQESRSMAAQVDTGAVRRTALHDFFERTREMADLIVRSCQRAAGLILSFKQVAVEQPTEQLRAFDLRQVVDDHLVALAAAAGPHRIAVRNQVPAAIECVGYPGTLGQIVVGLVDNALVHAFEAQDDGAVTLSAEVERGWVTLSVRDNGKGMSAEVLKRVFDPFFTTRLGHGQNGLGLTICHNLASGLLGGHLQALSTEGEGSVFLLSLPLQAPHRAQSG